MWFKQAQLFQLTDPIRFTPTRACMSNENVLFAEYPLNHLFTLKNKILMAPMTRAKADHDLVAMGRLFISNPDLMTRLRKNVALSRYDVNMLNTLY